MSQSLQTIQSSFWALHPKPVNTVPHSPLRRLYGLTLTFDSLRAALRGTDSFVLALGVALLAIRATWTRAITLHVLISEHVLESVGVRQDLTLRFVCLHPLQAANAKPVLRRFWSIGATASGALRLDCMDIGSLLY